MSRCVIGRAASVIPKARPVSPRPWPTPLSLLRAQLTPLWPGKSRVHRSPPHGRGFPQAASPSPAEQPRRDPGQPRDRTGRDSRWGQCGRGWGLAAASGQRVFRTGPSPAAPRSCPRPSLPTMGSSILLLQTRIQKNQARTARPECTQSRS